MEGSLSYRLICTIACSKCEIEDIPRSSIDRVLILSNVLIFREIPLTIPDTSYARSHCLNQARWQVSGQFLDAASRRIRTS